MLTRLLQAVVYWAYSLDYDVGALPVGYEFAAGAGEEQEYAVHRLELLSLGYGPEQ